MKKKILFSAAVLAAVLTGCSQDEWIDNNNLQVVVDRPMVEAPTISLGVDTKMTTTGAYAGVKWEEGDGFGAALMDTYVSGAPSWDKMFPIQDYISSNILYKWSAGTSFSADATLAQGNYLFYAPYNEKNFTREPLAVSVPLKQTVNTSNTAVPNNTAIAEFYESGEYPVFVAYDSISSAPKTSLSLSLTHIYALPRITLKLGDVLLLDEEGEYKFEDKDSDGTKDAGEDYIYESSITVDSIEFVNTANAIVTSGKIKNANVIDKLSKKWNKTKYDASKWETAKYENAATADLLYEAKDTDKDKKIVVKFEPALTITAAKAGDFGMILPGANYLASDLAVKVYATINGEKYVSAQNSKATASATISPARDFRLLPGLPYAADEYNADGTLKASKGTSATYTVEGGFIPYNEKEISGYMQIANYDELVDYITNVAYRGEELAELTETNAKAYIADNNGAAPDVKKYFVVTDTIELDDNFITKFNNACVITGKNASISFQPNGKVFLGDITFNTKTTPFTFDAGELSQNDVLSEAADKKARALGNVTLKGTEAAAFELVVEEGAVVTLDAGLTNTTTATVVTNNGGTINAGSAALLNIANNYGELNITKAPAAASVVKNGLDADPDAEDAITIYSTMDIDVDIDIANLVNDLTGTATVGACEAVFETNNSLITVDDVTADVTVTTGAGEVNNTKAGKVTNTADQTVYAEVGAMTDNAVLDTYDAATALNKLVMTGVWTLTADGIVDVNTLFATGNMKDIKAIDVKANSGISMGTGTIELVLTNVLNVNVYDNVNWRGRDVTLSSINLSNAEKNIMKSGKNITEKDINVSWKAELRATAAEALMTAVNAVSGNNALNQISIINAVKSETVYNSYVALIDITSMTEAQVIEKAAVDAGVAINQTRWNIDAAAISGQAAAFVNALKENNLYGTDKATTANNISVNAAAKALYDALYKWTVGATPAYDEDGVNSMFTALTTLVNFTIPTEWSTLQ